MGRLVIQVPDDFVSPLQPEWTCVDHALILHIGCDAFRRVRQNMPPNEEEDDTINKAQTLIQKVCEYFRAEQCEENKTLHGERIKMREELIHMRGHHATLCARADADIAEARMEERSSADRMRHESECDLKKRIAGLERDVDVSREFREENLRDSKSKSEELCSALTSEKAMTQRLTNELAELRCSSIKGRVAEQRHREILVADGWFCVDTSSGSHNTHFHDTLVATRPLLDVYEHPRGGVPQYETSDGSVRLSLESKQYSASSSSMTAELIKFERDRGTMCNECRAECFLFVTSLAIPQRNKRRYDFEVQHIPRNHGTSMMTVTGYLCAPDLAPGEIAAMVRAVMTLQTAISGLHQRLPHETEALQRLADFGDDMTGRMQKHLDLAENLCANVCLAHKQAEELRYAALENLLIHFATFHDECLIESSDATAPVKQALDSLEEETRGGRSKDKLIRNKEEHARLQKRVSKRARGKMEG
tara:strand:- start:1799 stop:3232 length:1434 start_codon:yes stop_codon:yes gene_type:complete